MPKTTTDEQIKALVNTMIDELGLSTCCDPVIGGSFKKGISGVINDVSVLALNWSPIRPFCFWTNLHLV
jgi:hypothetical protein